MTVSNEDSEFVRSLGRALLVLAVSALALLLIFFAYTVAQTPDGANLSRSKLISGKQLRAVMGTAQMKGDTLEITALKPYKVSHRALVVSRTTFSAGSYPFLKYKINGQHPGLRIYLIWRTAANPRVMSSARLYWNPDKPSVMNLANNIDWEGSIVEVGIDVIGKLRDQPLTLSQLALMPHSWQTAMASVWSQWTAFRGWTGRSINTLQATPDFAALSPVIVMAAWSGAALMLLFGLAALKHDHKLVSYGAVIVIPWIALDLLWQSELSTQLEESEFLFGGKTSLGKHLADVDSHIYAHATRLRDEVLPPAGARIFILHNSDDLNFDRLKTQYYLLPHNIYNYGRTPPTPAVRPGDYILVLGNIPGLSFRPDQGRLVWGEHEGLSVALSDSDPQGTLYRVNSPLTKSSEPAFESHRVDRNG
jgi:hypothetical protein